MKRLLLILLWGTVLCAQTTGPPLNLNIPPHGSFPWDTQPNGGINANWSIINAFAASGASSLPGGANGTLQYNNSGAFGGFADGSSTQVLHGGRVFGSVVNGDIASGTINLTTKVTGLLPLANGGTGTASPGLIQGTNITITGSWPNQTINVSGGGTVTPTGSPANGNLTKFSGAASITNGDLSGDCTTSGSLAILCTKSNGVAFASVATSGSATDLSAGILAVARGGTGIGSGNSGGILGYTAAGTLASSPALAATLFVKGGGAGVTPSSATAGESGGYLIPSESINMQANATVWEFPNAAAGTSTGSLVKLIDTSGTMQVTKTATTDINNAFGCVQSGAGASGTAQVAALGTANCLFDNVAVTDADFVIVSTAAAGTLSDSGSSTSIPTGVLNLGRARGTHAPCGAAPCGPYSVVLMTPDALGAAGTGIVANPGSTQTIQATTDATGLIIKQSNTTNTADIFNVQDKSANKDVQISPNGYVAVRGPEMDCTLFAGADMSLQIRACLQALNSLSTISGIADARGFTGVQTWSVNPFPMTTSGAPTGIPASGDLLLGPVNMTWNAPVLVPSQWRMLGYARPSPAGGTGTSAAASSSWPTTVTAGTITAAALGAAVTVTGAGTAWTTALIGCAFVAPAGGSSTDIYGFISNVSSTTALTLGFATGTTQSAGTSYDIFCPMTVQGDAAHSGPNTPSFGVEISYLDLACNNKAGCVGMMNWGCQERCVGNWVSIRDFSNIGLLRETVGAQNSGPYDHFDIRPGTSCITGASGTLLVADRVGPVDNAAGMNFGSHDGTLCSAPPSMTVGMDLETNGAVYQGNHMEDVITAYEVGGIIACPVACAQPSIFAGSVTLIGNDAGGVHPGTNVVLLGANAAASNLIIGTHSSNGGGYTNLINDSANSGCTVSTSAASGREAEYLTNASGLVKVDTSGACLKGAVTAFATATTAGTCATPQTATVTGAKTGQGMACSASPRSTPGVGSQWSCFVSASNTITLNECAVATSAGGSIAFDVWVTN